MYTVQIKKKYHDLCLATAPSVLEAAVAAVLWVTGPGLHLLTFRVTCNVSSTVSRPGAWPPAALPPDMPRHASNMFRYAW